MWLLPRCFSLERHRDPIGNRKIYAGKSAIHDRRWVIASERMDNMKYHRRTLARGQFSHAGEGWGDSRTGIKVHGACRAASQVFKERRGWVWACGRKMTCGGWQSEQVAETMVGRGASTGRFRVVNVCRPIQIHPDKRTILAC